MACLSEFDANFISFPVFFWEHRQTQVLVARCQTGHVAPCTNTILHSWECMVRYLVMDKHGTVTSNNNQQPTTNKQQTDNQHTDTPTHQDTDTPNNPADQHTDTPTKKKKERKKE